jgi:acyl-coenzyme A synthetase/AMP-(fatty) acid ligase
VADTCVIGVPDERQGERVIAVVVLKDPAQQTHEVARALIDFCRQRLIKWACPREVEFRSALPRTRIGKADFKTLTAEYVARKRAGAAGIASAREAT